MTDYTKHEKRRPVASGVFLLGLGILILAWQQGTVADEGLWPALLVLAGIALIAGAIGRKPRPSEPQPPDQQPVA